MISIFHFSHFLVKLFYSIGLIYDNILTYPRKSTEYNKFHKFIQENLFPRIYQICIIITTPWKEHIQYRVLKEEPNEIYRMIYRARKLQFIQWVVPIFITWRATFNFCGWIDLSVAVSMFLITVIFGTIKFLFPISLNILNFANVTSIFFKKMGKLYISSYKIFFVPHVEVRLNFLWQVNICLSSILF